MVHPLLSLGRHLWRVALPLLALLAVLAYLNSLPASRGGIDPFVWLLVFCPLVLRSCWQSWWVWRMARRVWRFRTVRSPRLLLHHAPGLEESRDCHALLRRFESDLDDLSRCFRYPLRGRLRVFLFASGSDVSRVFRRPAVGMAVHPGDIICLGEDAAPEEAFRHELCHLFAFHWNMLAPPLLDEGLPTWLQTGEKAALHAAALSVLRTRNWRLDQLLRTGFFFSGDNSGPCYLVAGSFTGFLIENYGWDSYLGFFRSARTFRFRARFEAYYRITLDKAEQRWRASIEAANPHTQEAAAG